MVQQQSHVCGYYATMVLLGLPSILWSLRYHFILDKKHRWILNIFPNSGNRRGFLRNCILMIQLMSTIAHCCSAKGSSRIFIGPKPPSLSTPIKRRPPEGGQDCQWRSELGPKLPLMPTCSNRQQLLRKNSFWVVFLLPNAQMALSCISNKIIC